VRYRAEGVSRVNPGKKLLVLSPGMQAFEMAFGKSWSIHRTGRMAVRMAILRVSTNLQMLGRLLEVYK